MKFLVTHISKYTKRDTSRNPAGCVFFFFFVCLASWSHWFDPGGVPGGCNQMQLITCQDRRPEPLWVSLLRIKNHNLKKLGQNVILSDTRQILNYTDQIVLPYLVSHQHLFPFFQSTLINIGKFVHFWWHIKQGVAQSHAEKWHKGDIYNKMQKMYSIKARSH